jgi:hypothetical protein
MLLGEAASCIIHISALKAFGSGMGLTRYRSSLSRDQDQANGQSGHTSSCLYYSKPLLHINAVISKPKRSYAMRKSALCVPFFYIIIPSVIPPSQNCLPHRRHIIQTRSPATTRSSNRDSPKPSQIRHSPFSESQFQ